MNWEIATFAATAVVQLLAVGIVYGRFEQKIADGERERVEMRNTMKEYGDTLGEHTNQIGRIQAYQDGFRDGKQLQREHTN